MVEVFITDIRLESDANKVLASLKKDHPDLEVNFDLEDFNAPYPCGHSVLRMEGSFIDTYSVLRQLKSEGIKCQILEDKICN
ncbi:hypothetical protein J8L85_07325 [Maribacter sp. MMG018]|uniref:hypothetical protein n=1 Tax=Maribacter sp. MMG018 TaxID=2822688 RepID=UPI001B3621FF|nr:hypothetical protein [Maribacter sp. MMG018]MBQ4914241.1 hypothetical protein [Maribacter sp. MMG018]